MVCSSCVFFVWRMDGYASREVGPWIERVSRDEDALGAATAVQWFKLEGACSKNPFEAHKSLLYTEYKTHTIIYSVLLWHVCDQTDCAAAR